MRDLNLEWRMVEAGVALLGDGFRFRGLQLEHDGQWVAAVETPDECPTCGGPWQGIVSMDEDPGEALHNLAAAVSPDA